MNSSHSSINIMKPFIVIRPIKSADHLPCQTLIKDYVMSYANDAFLSCLFREITIQLIVLVWAIMFIFFGFPLTICFWSIPGVIIFLYVSVQGAYFNKAIELANQNPDQCWVAEVYAPYFLRADTKDIDYEFVTEDQLSDCNVYGMHHEIVGTISVRDHHSLHNCGWLSRSAVHTKYSMDKIGERLILQVLTHCWNRGYYTVEAVTTECQYGIRELMLRMGFKMKQIYHKTVIAHMKIMKSQLGIDLHEWISNMDQDCPL